MGIGHRRITVILALLLLVGLAALETSQALAAYQHMGEADSASFAAVHPDRTGTKLDSCSLCHSGGSMQAGGKSVSVGSCQWCHYRYGYDAKGSIADTLNPYGREYLAHGRSADAVRAIESLDSDGDGYSNGDEIAATRYPGDPSDDPTKVPAPFKVFSREELEKMPQHTQLLLMNASKSTDVYSSYSGVPMEDLIKSVAGKSATGVTVFSPDGFAQYHPLAADPQFYQVFGPYPPAVFFYDEQADLAKNPKDGWCDYGTTVAAGLKNGDKIVNVGGLKLLLAIRRDGKYLSTGVLNPQNKLDGEGPFRVLPPQLNPAAPDQGSSAKNQSVVWPYDDNNDHNAGFATRSATIIRVEPLPEGMTDIDTLEAGWDYVDEAKVIVYGAIDPTPTVRVELDRLMDDLRTMDGGGFRIAEMRDVLLADLGSVGQELAKGNSAAARQGLEDIVSNRLSPDSQPDGSWISDRDAQKRLIWSVNEVLILLRSAS